MYEKITTEQHSQLKEAWLLGASVKTLARHFQVHPQTIARWMKEAGLARPAWRPDTLSSEQRAEIERYFVDGKDCDVIGALFGISGQTVRNYCFSSTLLWARKESIRRNRLEDKFQNETLTFI